jgi:tetratricopeptide (TPR) repeat protein
LAALPLFEKAAQMQPDKSDVHINLGVTQMRLGLLDAAKMSFQAAKAQLGGMPGASLKDNMQALKEHYVHARSINHDTTTVYAEWSTKVSGDDGYDDYDYGGDSDQTKGSNGGVDAYDPYSVNEMYSDRPAGEKEESERATNEAIALAEAGDVVTSLPLFEKAVKLNPTSAKHYENLGVTQMRYAGQAKVLLAN